jgi:hypothetical protein
MRDRSGIISWQWFYTNAGEHFATLNEFATCWPVLESTAPQVASRAEAIKIIDELRRGRFDAS